MKRFLLLTVVLLMIFGISASLYAQQGAPVKKTILDYRSDLNLTNSQVEKIKGYLTDFENRAKGLGKKLNHLNQEIRSYLEKDAALNEVNKKKIREAFAVRAELAIDDIETGTKINKTLTPEQFKKWKEIRTRGGEKKTLPK